MKKIIFPFVAVVLLLACKHQPNLPTPDSGGNSSSDTTVHTDTSICFERDILPIFSSNCAIAGCHDAATHAEDYILNSYSNIMNSDEGEGIEPGNADESEIYEVLTEDDADKRMPLGMPPLSAGQISLIRRWINEGAQNGTNCQVLCDTSIISFSTGIKPILQQNCTGCHNSGLAQDGIDLSTYATLMAVVNDGRLLGAIRHQNGFAAMPQGAAKLTDCKIRQVEKWIEAGAPND